MKGNLEGTGGTWSKGGGVSSEYLNLHIFKAQVSRFLFSYFCGKNLITQGAFSISPPNVYERISILEMS